MPGELAIIARFKNLAGSEIKGLSGDLSALEKGAAVASRGFSGLQSIAKTAMAGIGVGIAGVATGFVAAAGAGFKFNSSMEQVEAQLFAFLKDGDKVAGTLDMIKDRASRTPFAFEEMANAAAGLIPAAKQSGRELEHLISIAEVLAASNPAEGLEGAAFALREALSGDFASIIERFNLPRQRLNELKEEGVPALEAVSTAMRELGLDADLVTNLADTAVGRWSTIQDTLVGIAASLTQPIFAVVSAGMGDLITKLDAAKPIIDGVVGGISGLVENLVAGQPFVQALQGAVIDVAEALGLGRTRALEIALELTNLITAVQNGWQVFTDFLQPLTDFVTGFVSWKDVLVVVGGILASVVVPALISLAAAAAPVILVFSGLVLAVATLRTVWEENFAGIQELATGLWEGLQVAFDGVKQLLEGDLTGAMETFRLAWETGWTTILEFVGNLWGLLEPYLSQAWESVVAWFNEQPWGEIGRQVIVFIVTGLSDFAVAVQEKLVEWNQAFLDWAGAENWTQVGDMVSASIVASLSNFKELAAMKLVEWNQAFLDWAGAENWTQVGDMVSASIVASLSNFKELAAMKLVEWNQAFLDWAQAENWSQVGDMVSASLVAGLSTFGELITPKLEEWNQSFLNWAQADNWTQIGNDFVTLIQAGAGEKFGEFETSIFQNGIELVGKLLDGLATFTTTALSTFTDWTNTLTGWVSSYDWSQLGYDVTNAIIEGLKAFVALVVGAGGILETWRQGFVTWASNVENWKALGKAVVDNIIAGWKFTASVKTAINQFFLGVIKAVREALGMGTGQPVMLKVAQDAVLDFVKGAESKIFDVVSIGQSIVEGLRTGIEGKIKEVAEWGARMVRAIIDAARGAAQSHSPSKVTTELGIDIADGPIVGIEKRTGALQSAGAGMANAIAGGFSAMAGVGGGAMAHLDSLMNAIRAGVAAFGNLTEQTKAYVELLNSVIGVFKEAVGLISTLQGVTNTASVEPVVLWINHQLLVMAQAIQAGTNAFGGSITAQTKPYIELVNAAVATFKEAVVTIAALQGVTNTTSVEPVVLWINHQLLVMSRAIQAGANAFGEVAANTKAYIELVKEIISLVADGVAALAAIGSFVPLEDATAKIAVFVQQVLDVTSQFATGIAQLGERVVEQIVAAAELSPLIKELLDAVKTAVDALAAISKFVAVENLKQQLAAFVTQTVALLGSFASGLAGINSRVIEQIVVAVELSPLVKELLGIVKTAVDALAAISKFVAVENLKQQLADFGSSLVSVIATMSQWFTKFNERVQANMTAAAGMAGNVKELFGIVKTATDALAAIGVFIPVENLRERLDVFASQLVLAVASMAFWFTKFNERVQANMAAAAAMTGDVKDMLGMVKTAVDSLKNINEFVGVTQLEEKIELFMHQLVRGVLFMTRELNNGLLGLEEALASAGNLSGLAKDVLETVKRGVDSLAALNDFVGVANLEATLALFGQQLVQTVIGLTTGLSTGLAGMEEALTSAGSLSGLAKDVLDTVKRGVDSLLALAEFSGVTNLASTLDVFVAQLVYTVQRLTAGLNAGLAGMEESLTSAGILSGLAKDVLESVKRGVDSLTALGEFEGVENLGATLSLFSSQFTSAVQSVTQTLNNIAKTIGQEALTAAAGVAGTIKGIADSVLASIRIINDLATSEEPQSLQGIMNQLVSAVTVQVPNMETVGFNFGASFATGVVSGFDLPTITQTFYDGGFVTGQSFGYGIADGIYASIPTAVDAAMELAASVQAALGGLSGGSGGIPSLPPIGAGGGGGNGNGGNTIVIYGLTVQGVQNPADLVAQLEAYAG